MDRIKFLIEQYLTGELSLEEKIELERWMDGAEQNRKFFEELTDPEILKSSLEKMDHFDRNRVWDKFQLGIRQWEETPAAKVPVRLMARSRFRWIAAAAIFVGITGGTYFLMHKRTADLPVIATRPVKTDLSPGGNRAVLTLSNGSKIILDSAHNGMLAEQGNTKIVKTDSGRLAYTIENNKSSEKSAAIEENILTTPRGGQYQLVLPDGTKVWLNAASSITYPASFAGNERKVTVTGEVYFEVVHNAHQPFRVKVNDQTMEDIGTSFNINAYPEETSVNTTLLEGSVKINKAVILKPGQQARIIQSKIHVVNDADLDEVMAWKNGKMNLTNCSVQQVMNLISRWYDVDIKYTGRIPVKNFFAVIDRNVPLSVVLEALQAYGVNTTLEGNTLVVQ